MKYISAIAFVLLAFVASAAPQVLRIGVGNFEPFFIEETKSGLFLDLIKLAYKAEMEKGLKLEFSYMPNSRLMLELEKKNIDAAANIPLGASVPFISYPFFPLQDVAVTLKQRQIEIDTLSDLSKRSVIAFQGARDFLGEQYREVAEANSNYLELANLKSIADMLMLARADVVVMDINIFLHSVGRSQINTDPNIFEYHSIFPNSWAHIGFNSEVERDRFNSLAGPAITSGAYLQIFQDYRTRLGFKQDNNPVAY